MKRKFNPHTLPSWLKTVRGLAGQFIIPFCVFQGIRTLLLPTAFDILFLGILILIAFAFRMELI
ncbi:hypothetical protein [Cytobacillus purgationiresistens]|uniref:Membrane protein YszA n=1 Tax=Cytobacillus purgationiresistens TaxID=863449 RepID=A0ABU0AFG4_9BACI|nr:hypothetical protein [Cytobacillus purgationiresistens]MDQ0269999.1 hypothetical protein [Cytobacillus purgationiresistens]